MKYKKTNLEITFKEFMSKISAISSYSSLTGKEYTVENIDGS